MGRLRLSLSTKIFAGLGFVLFLLLAIHLRSVYQLRQIGDHLRLLNRSYLPLAKLTSLLDSVQSNRRLDFNRFLKLHPERWGMRLLRRLRFPGAVMRRLQGSRRFLKGEALRKLEPNLKFPQEVRRSLSSIESRIQRAHALLKKLQAPGRKVKQALLDRRAFALNERALQREISSLAVKVDFRLTQVVLQAERQERRAMFLLLFLSAFAILVVVAALLLSRIPLRRIQRLAGAAQRIGQGDYQSQVPVASRDEIGVLAEEFNRMTQAVRERQEHLAQKSRELERAYRDLQISSERLRRSERLAAIGQLAAQITHEVRNPLNAIGLNLELLEEDLDAIPEASEVSSLLTASMEEVERLTLITEEYLRFASLPSPKLERADINVILSDMMEFLREELVAKGIEWSLELAAQVPPSDIDQRQIRQALLNLIRNAMQAATYSSEPKRQAQVTISTRSTATGIEIEIRDNGPGIPLEAQDKIFDPFFSTKEEGTGLGLPLTQQIIVGHGGEISCHSEPGQGTRFVLVLPGE